MFHLFRLGFLFVFLLYAAWFSSSFIHVSSSVSSSDVASGIAPAQLHSVALAWCQSSWCLAASRGLVLKMLTNLTRSELFLKSRREGVGPPLSSVAPARRISHIAQDARHQHKKKKRGGPNRAPRYTTGSHALHVKTWKSTCGPLSPHSVPTLLGSARRCASAERGWDLHFHDSRVPHVKVCL